MLNFIDNFLNKITMYRLVLYYVLAILCTAIILSFFGVLVFNPLYMFCGAIFIVSACLVVNYVFAKVFTVPANVESAYITAIILALIISPPTSLADLGFLALASWAAVWAMASKYIFAIYKKHIFNPVAFAVALTALVIGQAASWWVGTAALFPVVLIGGILLVRKLKRTDVVVSFLLVASVVIIFGHGLNSGNIITTAKQILFSSPIFFFAFVMLTEPLTMPPKHGLRIAYGILIGLLFFPSLNIGPLYFTPELALIAGNIFSYIVSPKKKLLLRLKDRIMVAKDTYNFVFEMHERFLFSPGQYMEWTIPPVHADSRGNRRYFTIASSPTENELIMGVKFYPNGSTFKGTLGSLKRDDHVLAGSLAGDFTLPDDLRQKMVFIAGGIGVTPFRSMVKYMTDMKQHRDVVMFYSNKTYEDIAYKDVFDTAGNVMGMKTVYVITDPTTTALPVNMYSGMLDQNLVMKEVPDWRERMFYLSGPHGMVTGFGATLSKMGVPESRIIKDFFPGFA